MSIARLWFRLASSQLISFPCISFRHSRDKYLSWEIYDSLEHGGLKTAMRTKAKYLLEGFYHSLDTGFILKTSNAAQKKSSRWLSIAVWHVSRLCTSMLVYPTVQESVLFTCNTIVTKTILCRPCIWGTNDSKNQSQLSCYWHEGMKFRTSTPDIKTAHCQDCLRICQTGQKLMSRTSGAKRMIFLPTLAQSLVM